MSRIKICRDLRTLKTVFFGQEVHYFMVYIAYFTELNLQICDYAQKRRICRENSKYAPDKSFVAIFALAERLPTSATLHIAKVIALKGRRFQPKNFVSRTSAAQCTKILQLLIVPNRE